MINRLIFCFIISVLLVACTHRQNIEGDWNLSYFDSEASEALDFFFNDFDLFNPDRFVPIVHINKDSIGYPLGIGMSQSNSFSDNYFKYHLLGSDLTIMHNNDRQSFKLDFGVKESFCLSDGNVKVACFTKNKNPATYSNYSIDLQIINEYYDHKILVKKNRNCFIYRNGVKSDSTIIELSLYETEYLTSLINQINFDVDKNINQSIGGDYTEYILKLNFGNETFNKKFWGLREISFGMKSLLLNLEQLSKREH